MDPHDPTAPTLILDGGVHTFEGETFRGDQAKATVICNAAEVRFRGCTFTGGLNRALEVRGGRVRVEDGRFVGNRLGVWASDGAEVDLEGCRFEGPGSLGACYQRHARGVIAGCDFAGYRDADLLMRDGAAPTVRDCRFAPVGTGVLYEVGGGGVIEDCRFEGGLVAINLQPGATATVRRCHVAGAGSVGLACDGAGTFEDNVFVDDLIGLCFGPGARPDVAGGRVRGGMIGIYARNGAEGAVRAVSIDTPSAIVLVAGALTTIDCPGVAVIHAAR